MEEAQAAQLLIEAGKGLNKKVSVYLTRLLLRIFEAPALQSFLSSVGTVPDEEKGEGAVKIQLDFLRLPQEVLPQVKELMAAPNKFKEYKYVKNGVAHYGIEIPVKPDDFPGYAYDYAF